MGVYIFVQVCGSDVVLWLCACLCASVLVCLWECTCVLYACWCVEMCRSVCGCVGCVCSCGRVLRIGVQVCVRVRADRREGVSPAESPNHLRPWRSLLKASFLVAGQPCIGGVGFNNAVR